MVFTATGTAAEPTRAKGPGVRVGVVAAALAGPLLVALATRAWGVNLSPDTLTYLRGADAWAADGPGGVLSFPTALHAPGLSLLLSPAAALERSVEAARWLNVGLLALCAAAVGLYLSRHVRPVLAVTAAGVVGLGYPMVHVASWLTSEPLYIALTLAHLAALIGLVRTPRPVALAVGAGLAVAAAVLVRYSGVSILPFGLLAVALLVPRGRRLAATVGYLAPVALLAGGWLARNVALTGYPTGDRASNEVGVIEVLADGADTAALWFGPPGFSESRRVLLGAAVIVVVLVAALLTCLRLRRAPAPTDRARPLLAAVLATYLGSSAVMLIVLVSATNTDPMNDRLLSALWPPLVALAVLGADLGLDHVPERTGRLLSVTAALAVVPLLALGASTVRTVHAAAGGEWTGDGLNGPHWSSAEVRTLVDAAPPHALLVGNEPYGLTVLAGRDALESPRHTSYASTEASEKTVDVLAQLAATHESYLIWTRVDDEYHPDHVAPTELARELTLVPVAATGAGATYRVLPVPPR